jgi:hypothetical protein
MRLSSSACQAANLPPELRGAALAYWVRESEFPLLEPNKKLVSRAIVVLPESKWPRSRAVFP